MCTALHKIDNHSNRKTPMVSKTMQITAIFVVLAVVLAYATSEFVGGMGLPVVVLLGVGVILPTVINQWRSSGSRA